METTHIPEETQAQFQRCVNRAIELFFQQNVKIERVCEMAVVEILKMRSPEVAASALGEPIWLLLEAEVTDKLRGKVGLKEKEPIIQTPLKNKKVQVE